MTGKLTAMLLAVTRQKDIFLVVLLALVLLMVILPLPEFIIDILITVNISAAILILLTSFQLQLPTQFSTFPSILLLTTLFRLAISISTTRLILMNGSAGEIIKTFGDLVIGGNLVVGLVIFLVITIVQFLVITKGADRVAEVGARFTLDGMPGRQMSIDADVRAGNLDLAGAQQARRNLELEAKLFGSMDGAMKFVKGDAVASLVITFVNLCGGGAIGIFQRGLPISEALHLYSLMTVGEGLVAQIPALMISVAAGNLVTRSTHPEGLNLGSEIFQQILADHRTIFIAGILIIIFGLIPGFPTVVFFTIGGAFALWVYFTSRQMRRTIARAEEDWTYKELVLAETGKKIFKATGMTETVSLVLPPSIKGISVSFFWSLLESLKTSLEKEFGITTGFWKFELGTSEELYEIVIKQELAATGKFHPGAVFVKANPGYLRELNIECLTEFETGDGAFVEEKFSQKLKEHGIEFWSPCEQLMMHLKGTIIKRLEDFADFQSVADLLGDVQRSNPLLVHNLREALPDQQTSKILRLLLKERIPLTSRLRILEAILRWSTQRPDPIYILQKVRHDMGYFISNLFAPNGFLPVIVAAPTLESFLREGMRNTEEGTFLVIEPSICRHIADKIRKIIGEGYKPGHHPILITQQDIRYTLYSILQGHGIYLPVMAYQEVSPDIIVYPIDYLSAEPEGA